MNPGSGAVEFAKGFVEGLTRDESLPILRRLVKGQLHDKTNKRIKKCDYCGYYYLDKTKPNNSRTCSRECKQAKDARLRAEKRILQAIQNPKKQKTPLYYWWLEYPFWINEDAMLKHYRKFETYYSDETDAISRRTFKRKPKNMPTDGSDRVHVRGFSYKSAAGEVKTYKMTREEIEKYLLDTHGAEKLKMERWRTVYYFSRSKKHDI